MYDFGLKATSGDIKIAGLKSRLAKFFYIFEIQICEYFSEKKGVVKCLRDRSAGQGNVLFVSIPRSRGNNDAVQRAQSIAQIAVNF